jgi:hypothetical protein
MIKIEKTLLNLHKFQLTEQRAHKTKEYTRCIKKTQPRNFPRNRHCFDDKRFYFLGAWEFKIAQLSKLLHTRVHKAKFMHLFNTLNKF